MRELTNVPGAVYSVEFLLNSIVVLQIAGSFGCCLIHFMICCMYPKIVSVAHEVHFGDIKSLSLFTHQLEFVLTFLPNNCRSKPPMGKNQIDESESRQAQKFPKEQSMRSAHLPTSHNMFHFVISLLQKRT